MARMYSGNTPETDQGWRYLTHFRTPDARTWEMWGHITEGLEGIGWLHLKVFVRGKRYHKANYWLSWNGERLADNPASRVMAQYDPELREAVETQLHKPDPVIRRALAVAGVEFVEELPRA